MDGSILRTAAASLSNPEGPTWIEESAISSATVPATIGEDGTPAPRDYAPDVDDGFDSREFAIASRDFRKVAVVIVDAVWISAQTVITRGVRIGRRAIIATNGALAKIAPPYSIAAGISARALNQRPEEAMSGQHAGPVTGLDAR